MANIFIKLKNRNLFSNSENQIVSYILDNPHKIIHMNVRTIAAETFTSPTTVMRVCKKIGCNGFSDFRIELTKELSHLSQTSSNIQNEHMSKKMSNILQIMDELTDGLIKSIIETQHIISPNIINDIVNVMTSAKVIDIYGRGSSYSVGKDFQYKIHRLGFHVQMFEGIDLQAIQAYNSDKDHCAIIISSTGETPEIVNFAKILTANGTPIITVTGSQDCSLLNYSDYSLFFKCFESNKYVGGITSRNATQYVLDVIYFALHNSNYEHFSKVVLNNYVPEDIAQKK